MPKTLSLPPSNTAIAEALEQVATMLAEREANPHRVQAYLHAASSVRACEQALADRYAQGGVEALKALPGVGDRLGSRIAGFIETGRLALVEELRAGFRPEVFFGRVAGIGPELARRLHQHLGVDTLEALEVAAHDGRLATVPGFGARRVRAIQQQLASLLGRATRRALRRQRRAALDGEAAPRGSLPPLEALLSVDAEYRARAEAGELEPIAPRRFNPGGEAWLPVLHTRRGSWQFTALFSNTPRAHALGKTRDWVVLYAERGGREQTAAVVTETRGPLAGRRVVRGREAECRAYYARPHRQAA